MAGIISSSSDATCSTHNALRDIAGYACGVTFTYRDAAAAMDWYAVPAIASCCTQAGGGPVQRIPGNRGCEMQFCVVAEADDGLDGCLRFVHEGDLPDDVGGRVASASSWCTVRMYDDASDESAEPVTAGAPPPRWSEAGAKGPFDDYLSRASAGPEASATSTAGTSETATPESGARGGFGWVSDCVWRVCSVQSSIAASLLFAGIVLAL